MNTDFEYDIFLSHNGSDKEWVERLGEQIESETIDGLPDSRKLRVFFDKWDIDIGDNFIARINDGLKRSRLLGCILSPEFMSSGWTTFEWTDIASADPINTQKRIVPIFLRDLCKELQTPIDLRAPFKSLNYIDFRNERKYEESFQRLIRRIRGLPPLRGNAKTALAESSGSHESDEPTEPDPVREAILGNLLPVTFIPNQLFSAQCVLDDARSIFENVRDPAPFILWNGQVHSFADLRDDKTSLRQAIDLSTIEANSLNDWLLDQDRSRQLMYLLKRCLISHLRRLNIVPDEKKRFYFRPDNGNSWSVATPGDRKRKVADEKKDKKTDETLFWVHHAARIQFEKFDKQFFLSIQPTFIFTHDGTRLVLGKKAGQLTAAWGGRQQNDAALRNVLFWSKVMAMSELSDVNKNDEIIINTGAKAIRAAVLPAVTRISVGIAFDCIKIQSLISQLDHDELDRAAEDVILEEGFDDDEEND